MMEECRGWREDWRPIFVREASESIGNWPVLAETVGVWTEEARLIAVGGYKQVLENVPDVPDEESDSERSDQGEACVESCSPPNVTPVGAHIGPRAAG
jgi:hypothetical protein